MLGTAAERIRKENEDNVNAALQESNLRLRPILMTSIATVVGMLPMAIGFGEGGEQTAPLGRAVIGGILASTTIGLIILPLVFAWIQNKASIKSVSLDPEDSDSQYYEN